MCLNDDCLVQPSIEDDDAPVGTRFTHGQRVAIWNGEEST
jgi:hypothetical protein